MPPQAALPAPASAEKADISAASSARQAAPSAPSVLRSSRRARTAARRRASAALYALFIKKTRFSQMHMNVAKTGKNSKTVF